MKRVLTLFFIFSICCTIAQAQRYLEPTFDGVKVTEDITYGTNATALLLPVFGEAVPEELVMDIYEPFGDTETSRPVVIMMHTGNFLPPSANGGCTGTRKDAAPVNVATRLAEYGYVVASIDYRLGWNPIAPEQTERVFTLINAAYRGVQDARTAIRFFRMTEAEQENPYGIDPDKAVVWGLGTGGYIALGAATLDTITDTFIPKFFAGTTPMVIEEINGNVDGTTVGIAPENYPGFPAGDTLCYPNHVGYSSDFQFAFNMGGALGDTSWIDADDVPTVSMQVPTDPFAPCETNTLLVPPPVNLPVVEVTGACDHQQIFVNRGTNDCIEMGTYDDPISERARMLNGDIESFYPLVSDDPTSGGDWTYSFSSEPYGVMGSDCSLDSMEARNIIDTAVMYFAPRAFNCLGLEVSTNDVVDAYEIGLQIAPNPASDWVSIQTDSEYPIESMRLFDLSGRMVSQNININTNTFNFQRRALPDGIYIIQLRTRQGVTSSKLVFN